MKMSARLTALVVVFAMALSFFSGCSGTGGTDSQNASGQQDSVNWKISFFKGGYGDEWINAITQEYTKEHPNVTFTLEGDADMTGKIGPRLESGANLPDIAFILGTNWQAWAAKGYLADLSDLYNSEVDNGKTLKDKLISGITDVGLFNSKYYIIPCDDGLSGFVYNAGMFEQYGWKVPETVSDLNALIPQIKAQGIKPFAWGGKVMTYWDFPVLAWWSQVEGADGMSTFLKMDSPDVFQQQGRLKALQELESIITDKTNSIDGAMGMDHIQSQMAFLQGKAAMMPNGAWVEHEMQNSIPDGFKMRIMPTPAIDGAKETKTTVLTSADFFFIPAKSKNIAAAKDFLKFMATDAMLRLYTEKTGTPRPFNYSIDGLSGLSDFNENVLEQWKECTKIYMYSGNPLYFSKFGYWPSAGAPYPLIQIGDETAQSCFDADYDYVKTNWNKAKTELGLDQ